MRRALLVSVSVLPVVWCSPTAAPPVPLRIERNLGRISTAVGQSPVEYLARGGDYLIALTARGMQLQSRAGTADLNVTFRGAGGKSLEPLDPLALRMNYYAGNDPARYVTDAATWSKLRYRDIYPGIDLILHQETRQAAGSASQDWEYDFSVAPGADPSRIGFEVQNARSLRIGPGGDLIATSVDGAVIRWRKPVSYQPDSGRAVESRFVLRGRTVSFRLGDWDHGRRLVIDPVLFYSVYFGGTTRDGARGVAVDSSGNVYIAGGSNSGDLPTAKSSYQPAYKGSGIQNFGDAFIARFNAAGTPTYVTYFGGTGDDEATSIAVDAAGNVYIAGATASNDLPTLNPAQSVYGGTAAGGSSGNSAFGGVGDAFVAKFNSSGGLVYSTFLGGSQDDAATGIAVDSTGAAYIVGATNSTGLFGSVPGFKKSYGGSANQFINDNGYPTINLGDAFVAKLSASGSQVLGFTYLGGSLDEAATTVTLDSNNNVWVGGCTNSVNFPTHNAYQASFGGLSPGALQPFANCGDAFLSELSSDLQTLQYSTFFGGNGDDAIAALHVDSMGTVYMAGLTLSTNFPLKNPVQSTYHGPTTLGNMDGTYGDAFVARLNPSSNTLMFSTYLGGSANDAASSMVVDSNGIVYIAGTTQSTDFPLAGALQTTMKGASGMESTGDAFISAIDPVASKVLYSSYLGGAQAEGVMGLALDPAGNLIIAGMTDSPDFPVAAATGTVGGQKAVGGADAFLAKFSLATSATCPIAAPQITSVNFATDFGGFSDFSSGSYLEVKGTNLAIDSRQWATGDFQGANAPISLDGSKVTVNGVPAYVSFISGQQINVQAPADPATGAVPVVVTNCAGTSNTVTLEKNAVSPGMLAPASFNVGKQYLVALFASDLSQGLVTFVGNTGLIAGANFRPAKPNDVIAVYGLGFGNVTPATTPGVVAGGSTNLAGLTISFGQTPAQIGYAGLYPGFVGLYEFYLTVPNVADGDYQINVNINGTSVPQTLFLTVHH